MFGLDKVLELINSQTRWLDPLMLGSGFTTEPKEVLGYAQHPCWATHLAKC